MSEPSTLTPAWTIVKYGVMVVLIFLIVAVAFEPIQDDSEKPET